jgi:hypothetical protein
MMKELLCAEMASQTLLKCCHHLIHRLTRVHSFMHQTLAHKRTSEEYLLTSSSVNVAEHTISNSKMRLSVFSRHGYSFKFTATQGRQVII